MRDRFASFEHKSLLFYLASIGWSILSVWHLWNLLADIDSYLNQNITFRMMGNSEDKAELAILIAAIVASLNTLIIASCIGDVRKKARLYLRVIIDIIVIAGLLYAASVYISMHYVSMPHVTGGFYPRSLIGALIYLVDLSFALILWKTRGAR